MTQISDWRMKITNSYRKMQLFTYKIGHKNMCIKIGVFWNTAQKCVSRYATNVVPRTQIFSGTDF